MCQGLAEMRWDPYLENDNNKKGQNIFLSYLLSSWRRQYVIEDKYASNIITKRISIKLNVLV